MSRLDMMRRHTLVKISMVEKMYHAFIHHNSSIYNMTSLRPVIPTCFNAFYCPNLCPKTSRSVDRYTCAKTPCWWESIRRGELMNNPRGIYQAMFPASPRKRACAASCRVQMPTFLMRRLRTVRSSRTSRAKASYI